MNPRKRQRQPATVDAEAVAIYEDLAHESEDIRLKAAKALLLRLGPESVDSEALRKAFRRLFRGLCSSRKAARLGFSVALTELLAQHVREDLPPGANNLLVEHILDDLEAQSRINGNISGQVSGE
jgi:DNA polymerase phi